MIFSRIAASGGCHLSAASDQPARAAVMPELIAETTPVGDGTVVGHNVPSDTVVVKLAADGRACACPKASVCGSRKAYESMHGKAAREDG